MSYVGEMPPEILEEKERAQKDPTTFMRDISTLAAEMLDGWAVLLVVIKPEAGARIEAGEVVDGSLTLMKSDFVMDPSLSKVGGLKMMLHALRQSAISCAETLDKVEGNGQ